MDEVNQTWLNISEQDLLQGIIQRTNCSEAVAEGLLEKLKKLNPTLRDDFAIYWNKGELSSSLEAAGYSLTFLVNNMKMQPVGAFTTLDWLIREPTKALEALKRGYDRANV